MSAWRGSAKRFAVACVLCLCAAPHAVSASSAGQGFADALELTRAGRMREALDTARAIGDPLAALQAEVHVLWAGGDLVGALSAGEAGLERFPADPYLLQQCGELATALGASARALACSARLDEILLGAKMTDDERGSWAARARELHERAVAADERAGARMRALARARWTVLAVAGLALLALLVPWRLLGASR